MTIPHIESTRSPRSLPLRRVSLAVAAAALAGIAAAGCGSDTTFDSLDVETQNLVRFESGWQCEVSRFAVDDASDLERLRAERQAAQEISDEAYAEFLARLAEDEELAQVVAEETSACLDGEPVQL